MARRRKGMNGTWKKGQDRKNSKNKRKENRSTRGIKRVRTQGKERTQLKKNTHKKICTDGRKAGHKKISFSLATLDQVCTLGAMRTLLVPREAFSLCLEPAGQ